MSFLVRLQAGERLTDLCREFEISRKTAYKFVDRYEEMGPLGLLDQRRVPERVPHRTPEQVVEMIVELRKAHPTWGPKKLREVLKTKQKGVRVPACSTIGGILCRKGLIVRKRRRKHSVPAEYATLSSPTAPNDLWCIDFKGEFRLGNGSYCYPLTVTDAASRYVLACEAFEAIDGAQVRIILEDLFKKVGMPTAIRFDGGAPFASTGLLRLSKLSAWWVSLGIKLEQIEPSSPQQNGRHERMHRTLKAETTRPPAARPLQQQQRFDRWIQVFNHERPHEALGMKCPADVYVASTRPYAVSPPPYLLHDLVVRVTSCGHIRFPGTHRREPHYFVSASLGGYDLGLRELDDGRWLVTFYSIDLGVIDRATRCFVPMPDHLASQSPVPTQKSSTKHRSSPGKKQRRKTGASKVARAKGDSTGKQ